MNDLWDKKVREKLEIVLPKKAEQDFYSRLRKKQQQEFWAKIKSMFLTPQYAFGTIAMIFFILVIGQKMSLHTTPEMSSELAFILSQEQFLDAMETMEGLEELAQASINPEEISEEEWDLLLEGGGNDV